MPDGQTSKSENLSYVAETFFSDRIVQFKLDAISESGLRTDYAVKNISIKTRKGRLVIYSSPANAPLSATAIINNTSYPITIKPTSQEPNCEDNIQPTFDLKIGTYDVFVTTGNFPLWSGSVVITEGGCVKLDAKP